MSNRPHPAHIPAAMLVLCGCLASVPARAEGPGPVYKDLERFERPMIGAPYGAGLEGDRPMRRPARVVQGDAGYVGSAYGLGKPSYTGLGSRPDPALPE